MILLRKLFEQGSNLIPGFKDQYVSASIDQPGFHTNRAARRLPCDAFPGPWGGPSTIIGVAFRAAFAHISGSPACLGALRNLDQGSQRIIQAFESGNAATSSGSTEATFVPLLYRVTYFPRTPLEESYSAFMSLVRRLVEGFFIFSFSCCVTALIRSLYQYEPQLAIFTHFDSPVRQGGDSGLATAHQTMPTIESVLGQRHDA